MGRFLIDKKQQSPAQIPEDWLKEFPPD